MSWTLERQEMVFRTITQPSQQHLLLYRLREVELSIFRWVHIIL